MQFRLKFSWACNLSSSSSNSIAHVYPHTDVLVMHKYVLCDTIIQMLLYIYYTFKCHLFPIYRSSSHVTSSLHIWPPFLLQSVSNPFPWSLTLNVSPITYQHCFPCSTVASYGVSSIIFDLAHHIHLGKCYQVHKHLIITTLQVPLI